MYNVMVDISRISLNSDSSDCDEDQTIPDSLSLVKSKSNMVISTFYFSFIFIIAILYLTKSQYVIHCQTISLFG